MMKTNKKEKKKKMATMYNDVKTLANLLMSVECDDEITFVNDYEYHNDYYTTVAVMMTTTTTTNSLSYEYFCAHRSLQDCMLVTTADEVSITSKLKLHK